jgi:hypothetical protein
MHRSLKTNNKELSREQREQVLRTLKARFEKNMDRHQGLEWDPQPLKQRVQFSFANHVCIPRRPVFRREEKIELIWSPLADVLPQVLDQLRRDFAEPVALERLYRLNLPVPYALCDLDGTLVERSSRRSRTESAVANGEVIGSGVPSLSARSASSRHSPTMNCR